MNLLFILFPAILIFLFIILSKTPKEVGVLYANMDNTNEFERFLYRRLTHHFPTNHVFLNYMFGKELKTTQIDLILITLKAVFVIEAKDYKGIVAGQTSSKNWTQILQYVQSFKSKHVSYTKYGRSYRKHYLKDMDEKHVIYNPVLQNQQHITSVQHAIDFIDLPIVNLVVFSDRCRLNIDGSLPHNTQIIQEQDFIKTIQKTIHDLQHEVDEEELNKIENVLICLNTNSSNNFQHHIARVKDKYSKS